MDNTSFMSWSVQKNEKTGPVLNIEQNAKEKLNDLVVTYHRPLKDIWEEL
jgi:hypothetical protein